MVVQEGEGGQLQDKPEDYGLKVSCPGFVFTFVSITNSFPIPYSLTQQYGNENSQSLLTTPYYSAALFYWLATFGVLCT